VKGTSPAEIVSALAWNDTTVLSASFHDRMEKNLVDGVNKKEARIGTGPNPVPAGTSG
jgi:hypothetical protein